MQIPRVKKCCFLDLLMGGKIVGLFGFMVSVAYIFMSLGVMKDIHYKQSQHVDGILNNSIGLTYTVYTTNLVVGIFMLICSFCMIYACTKQLARYINPMLVGLIVSVVWATVLMMINILNGSFVAGLNLIILNALQVYFWICTYSLYKELDVVLAPV